MVASRIWFVSSLFFKKHYNPKNAIMVVGGAVKLEDVKKLAEKWFAPIEGGKKYERNLSKEPAQTQEIKETVKADVPANAIYKVFKMPGRMEEGYAATDLISDILSQGKSSRLYQNLVQQNPVFSDINAYNYGSIDTGMFVFEGRLLPNVEIDYADECIWKELDSLKSEPVYEDELTKVKNKYEATREFGEMSLLDKAMNLAFYELYGDANLINTDIQNYLKVSAVDIQTQANTLFKREASTTLYYLAN
jgi:predicted Zn-dependent peptidase